MSLHDSERINAALDFATKKHEGQFRIGGEPYIVHPVAVAEMVASWGYGEDYQIAALFHDLLEDTDATEEELCALGGDDVLDAVKRLTKQKGYQMEQYISAVKEHPIAFAVKAADRLHNLRCATVASEDFKRRYILESLDWYLDFCPEIAVAVKDLARTLSKPMYELPLEYRPIKW